MNVTYNGPSDVYRIGNKHFPRGVAVNATDEQVARCEEIDKQTKHRFSVEKPEEKKPASTTRANRAPVTSSAEQKEG